MYSQWTTVVSYDGQNLLPEPPGRTVAPPRANVDFAFNEPSQNCAVPWADEYDTAQVNAFVGINATRRWFREAGGSAVIDVSNARAAPIPMDT